MNKEHTTKTEFLRREATRGLRGGGAWWGMDDDSGMRHIPFPVEAESGKASRKDDALDFIRDALWVFLCAFVAIKVLSFFGFFLGRFIDWAASFLF